MFSSSPEVHHRLTPILDLHFPPQGILSADDESSQERILDEWLVEAKRVWEAAGGCRRTVTLRAPTAYMDERTIG
jgi:hypothetical protein